MPSTPCLIQLNGDNVMVNLLPIMALKPERIIQLVTKDQRAARAVAQFKEVFALLSKEPGYEGYKPRIQDHTLPAHDLPEVRDTVARLLLENAGAVVNFSGGNKLMSVGAYQAAMALGRPSLFCDVDEGRFVSGRTAPMPQPPDYNTLISQFSIGLLMAVHGRSREEWRAEPPSEALRHYGLRAYELRNQQWAPLEAFNKALRHALFGSADHLSDSAEDLSALLAKPLPPSVVGSEPARQYLSAAAQAGLVKSSGPELFRLACAAKPREVEKCFRLLTCDWLELAVVDRVLRHAGYREVLWHPEPANGEEGGTGIFAIEKSGMVLRFIQCLGSLTRSPQDHLEAVVQRARRLGGSGAESTLVVLKTAQGQDSTLKHAAKRLGVELVLGAGEIVRRFTPA